MQHIIRKLKSSLYVIIGVVFIWRGVWVVLDVIDHKYFGGNNLWFAGLMIVVGLVFMELHDHRYDKLDHF